MAHSEAPASVVAYIDEFNFDNGLRAAGLGDCHWLDWVAYISSLTDVNIAVGMVDDALHRRVDRALIVSGDSDLVPAVRYLRDLDIDVVNVIPPRRKSDDLADACNRVLHVDALALRTPTAPDSIAPNCGPWTLSGC